MDIGTGSILITSGITYALVESNLCVKLVDPIKGTFNKVWYTIKHSGAVFLIGIVRPILVKFVNYQEHVSEYGIYWNFFLTIGVVVILASLVPDSWHIYACFLSLFTMLFYEALIHFTGLQAYILSDKERFTIIDKNKEGIFQCFGYLSCYFIGLSLGQLYKKCILRKGDPHYRLFWWQLIFCTSSLAVFFLSENFIERSSRRLVR